MSGFIYMEADNKNDPVIGKYEFPIKAIIESESNAIEKQFSLTKALFNIERSRQFAETVMGEVGFDEFEEVGEGQGAPNDTVGLTTPKTIYHHEYKKEFTITEKMFEDAKTGIASDAARRARAFTRSWYSTRDGIAQGILGNGASATYKGIDLKTADGNPLFYTAHAFTATGKKPSKASGTQCNYFKHAMIGASAAASLTNIEEILELGTLKMRNFKDENGEALGYTADTIILPGNSKIEFLVKKIVGSTDAPGADVNAVNVQYGNWTIVVLPRWTPANPALMLMSSDANKNLGGNMLYERAPLTIRNWRDYHTGNYIWNGRARLGYGFGTWKHILLVDGNTSNASATSLE